MTETAKQKPLWWRVGKGKWHEDPLLTKRGRPFTEEEIVGFARCSWNALGYCGKIALYYETRRTAPPVAQQCQHCRAAKAKEKGAGK